MKNKKSIIFFIDKNERNTELAVNALAKFGYDCVSASDYQTIDSLLNKSLQFDIVLIDVAGFDADIWERCKIIHQKNIPLIILSAKPSAALQQHGMRIGARGIVTKPLILKELIQLINSLIKNEEEDSNIDGA